MSVTALIDANVLYSAPVRDVLLELAAAKLFRARWSQDIHAEWMKVAHRMYPDVPAEKWVSLIALRKAGARHGFAPDWEAGNHTDRCVIRGHLRFGSAFEPNFHYDCNLRRDGNRRFVSCHGTVTLKRGRSHVNIAPNDNIR